MSRRNKTYRDDNTLPDMPVQQTQLNNFSFAPLASNAVNNDTGDSSSTSSDGDPLALLQVLQETLNQAPANPNEAAEETQSPAVGVKKHTHRHPSQLYQTAAQPMRPPPFLLYEVIGVLLSIVSRTEALLTGRRKEKTMYHLTTALRTVLAATCSVYEPALFRMPPCEFITQRGPRCPRIDRELGLKVALAPSARNVEQAAAACLDAQLVQVENMVKEQLILGTFRNDDCARWLRGVIESMRGARRVMFGNESEDEATGGGSQRPRTRLYVNFREMNRPLSAAELVQYLSEQSRMEPLNVEIPPSAHNYAFVTYYADDAEAILEHRLPGLVIRRAH